MSKVILLVVVVALTSCATENPDGPGGNIDGKADGWGTTNTPCDLCLRDYYACSTMHGDLDGTPSPSTCGNMFRFCMEDAGLEECESLDEPILTCSSIQDIYDICVLSSPGLDPVVCQSEFVENVNAVALETWCVVGIECNQCEGLYADCMMNSPDGTECLGMFSGCVTAGGLLDGSCAPVWEPGFDPCNECQGDYATCMETTDGSTCLSAFDSCVTAAEINDGSCAPVWEPSDPCGRCADGFSICLTEVPDTASCVDEFYVCGMGSAAGACEITCGLCQDIQLACESSWGEYELCITAVFAECLEAGGLSSDNCSPAYD